MNTLLVLFNQFNTYSKANPILAGVMSLWGAGMVTWLLRGVPLRIWNVIKHQSTTTLMMNNTQVGTNFETYNSFMGWLLKSKWMKYSRSMSLGGSETSGGAYDDIAENGIVLGIGDGTHFFTFEGRPYWVARSQMQTGQASSHVHYQLQITGLGRNRQRMVAMVDTFKYQPEANKLEIWSCDHDYWNRITSILPRPIHSVITEGKIKETIVSQIEKYQKNREWYHEKGLPYKLTYVLHGPTGTGKTSLIKAIATHFNRSICLMSLTDMSNGKLNRLLAKMPANSILLIEDFDSAAAVAKRDGVEGIDGVVSGGSSKPTAKFGDLTLSGILNAFDGIVSLDDRLIFLTTNVLANIDPAMIRPGRVDHVVEIGLLQDSTIKEYIAMMYPDQTVPREQFAPIAGSHLQGNYLENFDDYEAFIESIPKAA